MPIVFKIAGTIPFHNDLFYKDFYSFMSKNITYPFEARKVRLEGAVFVHFEVDNTGRVTNSAIIRDIGGGCAEEVNRVLLNVPAELIKWLVESSNSRKFTLPVLFGLEKPVNNWERPKSENFLLQEVHVTAVKVSREVPSQLYIGNQTRKVSSNSKINDLKKALEIPKKAKYLSLTHRSYTSFPLDILKLTNLEFLDLESNLLKDLPAEMERLTELEELYLVENKIHSLPASFKNLKKMKILGLASNKLESFPEEITSLENLEILDLSNNDLSTIPPSIGQLKNLKFLVLQNNDIKILPPEFYQLKKLEIIMLQGNPMEVKEVELLKKSFKKAQLEL